MILEIDMAKHEEKTNVMRILDQKNIWYLPHSYDTSDGSIDALSVAEKVGVEDYKIYKTLVTVGASGNHYVFVIPGGNELELKLAAKAVGEKSIAMIKQAQLLPLTGYIHGGCSPIGMKKQFKTCFEEEVILLDTVLVSAGKVGFQIEVKPQDLISLTGAITAQVSQEKLKN